MDAKNLNDIASRLGLAIVAGKNVLAVFKGNQFLGYLEPPATKGGNWRFIQLNQSVRKLLTAAAQGDNHAD